MKADFHVGKKTFIIVGGVLLLVLIIFAIIQLRWPGVQIHLGSADTFPNAVDVEISNPENHVYKSRQENKAFDFDTFTKNEAFERSVTSGHRIVYVVAVEETSHMIYEIAYNTDLKQNFQLEVPKQTKLVYLFMPEYATVKAVTKSNNPEAKEYAVIEGRESFEDGREGGGLKFRTFKVELSTLESASLKFDIFSEFEVKDINSESIIYGTYDLTLSKLK